MLVVVHACLALLYLEALPLFNWPDEPAHFNYVRSLSEGSAPGAMDASVWRPEELERLKRSHFEGVDPQGTDTAAIRYEAHQPPLYYALGALIYAAAGRREAVKLLNLLLSSAVILVIFVVGRRLFPERPAIAWAACLLAALVPTRCFMAVSIGNTVAAELCFAVLVLALATGCRPASSV